MKKIVVAENILREIEGGNTIFNRKGIELYSARTSEDILSLHAIERADLIITDAALPIMGGAELCKKVRSDPAMRLVSILAVCDDQEDALSQCRQAGANVVFKRPVDAGELLWKASELLAIPQRKSLRILLRVTIIGVEQNNRFFAQSLDISISGMQMETNRLLNVGDRLNCSFNIGHSEVSVNCVVERANVNANGRHRFGVRFVKCDAKSLVIIEQYIKAPERNQKSD